MGQLHLGGYKSRFDFSSFSKSIMVLTLEFDPSGILLGVRSTSPTMGQSVSGVFPELFHLWAGSGPLAYYHVLSIFSWKLGIVFMSANAFQSWNHLVGPSF